MTVYGTGPITVKHCSDCTIVNYGGSDYGIIPATYLMGWDKPNYPVPAPRRMISNAQRLIEFGEISAENGFDIETVFNTFVK